MRLLVFADLHLDAPFTWAPPGVARRRRAALRQTLERIVALAEALRVDALVGAGDLYEHERYAGDTGAFLQEVFARLACPVFLAPGNHDWYGPASLYRTVEWSPNVHVFAADRLTPVTLGEGLTLWGAAHRAPANTDGFLEGFHVDRAGTHVAVFHGSERGDLRWQEQGKVAHAPFTAAQIAAAGLHHALVGHYHSPRDAQTHTYPGNPDPLTFGESGARGAVLVSLGPDGVLARERHRVGVSEVHDVEVGLTGVAHAGEVQERVLAALAGVRGVVRVTLTGEVPPEVDLRPADLSALAGSLDGCEAALVRLARVRPALDLAALAGEPGVRGQFVRDVCAADLDEDTRRRVLLTGLRALDGRGEELEVS